MYVLALQAIDHLAAAISDPSVKITATCPSQLDILDPSSPTKPNLTKHNIPSLNSTAPTNYTLSGCTPYSLSATPATPATLVPTSLPTPAHLPTTTIWHKTTAHPNINAIIQIV